MTGSIRRIEEAAKAFWQAAGGRRKFGSPIDLERAVALALPLGICRMPALSSAKVAAVLERIGTVPWSARPDRPLRGCLVADLGVGLVFLDGEDPADEQRYSLAHEVAHFLLHYLQPRQHVLDVLGMDMAAVLDRARPPTAAERLSSALRDVVLEPFRHAMARTADGRPTHFRTKSIEAEADELADELIVPLAELRSRHDLTPEQLAADYGLPIWATGRLAAINSEESGGGVVSIFQKKRK
jgi:uncharacterized protein DUF955